MIPFASFPLKRTGAIPLFGLTSELLGPDAREHSQCHTGSEGRRILKELRRGAGPTALQTDPICSTVPHRHNSRCCSACLERTIPVSISSNNGSPAPELTTTKLEGTY